MELMQFNYFTAQGVLAYDATSGKVIVHEEKFHNAAAAMLRDVFEIQAAGDAGKAEAYITRWTEWKPELHEKLAEAMRSSEASRSRPTLISGTARFTTWVPGWPPSWEISRSSSWLRPEFSCFTNPPRCAS